MKALLVYPAHPPQTYWSFSGALPYVERRAALPPLGLVTLAAMLPEHWDLRLIDMNVAPLRDSDLLGADARQYVFLSSVGAYADHGKPADESSAVAQADPEWVRA